MFHAEVPRITNTIHDERDHLVGKESLTYTCQFEGFPLPNITFFHNGAVISPESGMTIVNNSLTIPSPQVSHSGIYQCIVSNEFGDDQIAWVLEIRQPSELVADSYDNRAAMNSLTFFSFAKRTATELHRA